MLKKMIGLVGCAALTLTFTGCPAEESKTPAAPSTDAATDAVKDGEAAADDAKKDAEAAVDGAKKEGE